MNAGELRQMRRLFRLDHEEQVRILTVIVGLLVLAWLLRHTPREPPP